jgi:23S rRNA (cytidine1920-2'-O)/16S rRNA (cytidine1409-2'-O)-methyltransferase
MARVDLPAPKPQPAALRAGRVRVDVALVERGLAETREKAQALVLAAAVTVDGRPVRKSAELVEPDAAIDVAASDRFVSRGGHKLEHALDRFGIDVGEMVCLDVGASTGGFTDCLLGRGARRVYAVDVGRGQLDWRLRNDSRVVVRERTNVRDLDLLPEPIDLATIDVSFISLRLALPPIARLVRPGGPIVALVKPQFEAGRGQVGRGGVVRDPAVHRRVLLDVWGWSVERGLTPRGLIASPLRGPAGNVEFLLWLENGGSGAEVLGGRGSGNGTRRLRPYAGAEAPNVEVAVEAALSEVPRREARWATSTPEDFSPRAPSPEPP